LFNLQSYTYIIQCSPNGCKLIWNTNLPSQTHHYNILKYKFDDSIIIIFENFIQKSHVFEQIIVEHTINETLFFKVRSAEHQKHLNYFDKTKLEIKYYMNANINFWMVKST